MQRTPTPSGPEASPPAASVRSFVLLVAWLLLVGTVAASAVFFLFTRGVPMPLVAMNAAWLAVLVLAARPAASKPAVAPCERCARPVVPTRHPSGVRLWTCFACGHERTRGRSIRELGPHASSPAGEQAHQR